MIVSFASRSEAISKAIVYGHTFKNEPSPEMAKRINRIRLAQRFGWTLDYIDSLDPFDVADITGVLHGDGILERMKN